MLQDRRKALTTAITTHKQERSIAPIQSIVIRGGANVYKHSLFSSRSLSSSFPSFASRPLLLLELVSINLIAPRKSRAMLRKASSSHSAEDPTASSMTQSQPGPSPLRPGLLRTPSSFKAKLQQLKHALHRPRSAEKVVTMLMLMLIAWSDTYTSRSESAPRES